MIFDSTPWKDDLRRTAKYLEGLSCKKFGNSERRMAAVEKRLMVGFYAIRKLIGAKKVADSVACSMVRVTKYEYISSGEENINMLNRHKILNYYKFDVPNIDKMSLYEVCNKLVHSYVFEFAVDSEGFLGSILFNSDKSRHSWLFEMPLSGIIMKFYEVAEGGVPTFSMEQNKGKHKKKDDAWIYRCE